MKRTRHLLAAVVFGAALLTAAPAAADNPATHCRGGWPGFEAHRITKVTGRSGAWLASVTYEWWDDCYTVVWQRFSTSYAVAPGSGWYPCGFWVPQILGQGGRSGRVYQWPNIAFRFDPPGSATCVSVIGAGQFYSAAWASPSYDALTWQIYNAALGGWRSGTNWL